MSFRQILCPCSGERDKMSGEEEKNRVVSHSSYGTFQGVPTYPPPSYPHPPSKSPVTGFPQPSLPPGASHNNQDPGIGWFLFIIGFLFGAIPWYIGVFIQLCARVNPHEKAGYVACTIGAVIATIAIIFGLMGGK